jgi:hypothetical protein
MLTEEGYDTHSSYIQLSSQHLVPTKISLLLLCPLL